MGNSAWQLGALYWAGVFAWNGQNTIKLVAAAAATTGNASGSTDALCARVCALADSSSCCSLAKGLSTHTGLPHTSDMMLTCRADEWQAVHIPLQSLVLTYQGQLVRRQLEFQASQVISVGVAASALPAAEAEAAGAVDLPDDFADLSSSSSEAASTSSAGDVQHSAASSVSTTAGDADSSAESLSAEGEDELQDSESIYPEHERFKLLIRSIQADVQF